jgi:hypothetical protein
MLPGSCAPPSPYRLSNILDALVLKITTLVTMPDTYPACFTWTSRNTPINRKSNGVPLPCPCPATYGCPYQCCANDTISVNLFRCRTQLDREWYPMSIFKRSNQYPNVACLPNPVPA